MQGQCLLRTSCTARRWWRVWSACVARPCSHRSAAMRTLECCICFGPLFDPVQLPCDHLFCRYCLLRWVESAGEWSPARPECPTCRQAVPANVSTLGASDEVIATLRAFSHSLHAPLALSKGALAVTGDVLGRGASATVYAGAYDGRAVAVKELRVANAREAGLLVQELRVAGILRVTPHPHVVRVHGATHDLHAASVRLVMDAHSRSLHDALLAGPVPPARARHYLRGLLAGLAFLHEARVVHGDVEPANVLLSAQDEAVLADFGLSKLQVRARGFGRRAVTDRRGTDPPPPPPTQGCVGREGTSEAAPEAVRQAVGGGFQSGWGAVTVGYKRH